MGNGIETGLDVKNEQLMMHCYKLVFTADVNFTRIDSPPLSAAYTAAC
jgi:hypothetical protein